MKRIACSRRTDDIIYHRYSYPLIFLTVTVHTRIVIILYVLHYYCCYVYTRRNTSGQTRRGYVHTRFSSPTEYNIFICPSVAALTIYTTCDAKITINNDNCTHRSEYRPLVIGLLDLKQILVFLFVKLSLYNNYYYNNIDRQPTVVVKKILYPSTYLLPKHRYGITDFKRFFFKSKVGLCTSKCDKSKT